MYTSLIFRGCRLQRCLLLTCRTVSAQSTQPATKADMDALRSQIRTLQQLLQQSNSRSQHSVERLAVVERQVAEIHDQTVQTPIVDRVLEVVMDHVRRSPALTAMVDQLKKRPGWLNKNTATALVVAIVLIWQYRAVMYQRTSEEVADLASRTLEQESLRETIQETLEAVASSPETLEALNGLLRRILQDPSTQKEFVNLVNSEPVQKALQQLLEVSLVDPRLQRLSGEFLLKGLDDEHVRTMLETQTQALVRETVLDESVQHATGIGARNTLWHAVAPSFLLRKHDNNGKMGEREESLAADSDGAEDAING